MTDDDAQALFDAVAVRDAQAEACLAADAAAMRVAERLLRAEAARTGTAVTDEDVSHAILAWAASGLVLDENGNATPVAIETPQSLKAGLLAAFHAHRRGECPLEHQAPAPVFVPVPPDPFNPDGPGDIPPLDDEEE